MKRWKFMVPLILFVALSRASVSSEAPPPLHRKPSDFTPAQLTEMFRNKSAREVIDFLTQIEDQQMERWEYVLDKVETGNIEWLKVALLLSPATDGDAAETLADALAEATTRAPATVFLLFGHHCYIPDEKVPASKQLFLEEIRRRIHIVERVADPSLAHIKAECISEYQAAARDVDGYYPTH